MYTIVIFFSYFGYELNTCNNIYFLSFYKFNLLLQLVLFLFLLYKYKEIVLYSVVFVKNIT